MSYNILPKNNNNIVIDPCITLEQCAIFKSVSFFNLYLTKQKELEDIIETIGVEQFNKLIYIININEFICNHLIQPTCNNTHSNIFFDLIEIATNLNLIDIIKSSTNCLHVTANYADSIKFFKHCDKDNRLKYECKELDDIVTLSDANVDYCFIEMLADNITNPTTYIIKIVKSLVFIINGLKKGALLVLKIDYLFYKPVIELLYILSCVFEKTYIIKPSTSNVLSFEKYIVCKNFINEERSTAFYNEAFVNKMNSNSAHLTSLTTEEIPCYFVNKITEIDVMLGQMLLESIQEIINISHSNNKTDKIETLKKNNAQKANVWGNKYKIHGNIFFERKNVFLTSE
jgi:hypothetical protein